MRVETMRCVVGLFVVVLGCSDSKPTAFDFLTRGMPALVAVESDTAAWTTLRPTEVSSEAATYSIPFAPELRVLVVCAFANGTYTASEMLATADDLDQSLEAFYVPDCRSDVAHEVTGSVHDDSGYLKRIDVFDTAAENYLDDFTYDVKPHAPIVDVVLSDAQNVNIVHDVDLTKPGPITVDVDLTTSDNLLMGSYSFDSADSDEMLMAYSVLTTKNGTAALFTNAPGTYVHPVSEILVDGDATHMFFEATTNTTYRGVVYLAEDVPGHLTWLPRLSTATLDPIDTAVTFPAVTFAYTSAQVSCSNSNDNDGSNEYVFASSAWQSTHGDPAIAFDTGVVGWDPAWVLGTVRYCSLSVEQQRSSSESSYTGLQLSATTSSRANACAFARRARAFPRGTARCSTAAAAEGSVGHSGALGSRH
jgi:hypothetical protein